MFDVRKAFYAAACLVSLSLSGLGAYTIISAGLRMAVFTEADRSYFTSKAAGDTVHDEEADMKNARAQRQRDMAWALSILVVNAPIFFWFYPEVKKKEDDFTARRSSL
jgi:hypothetical protein